MLAEKRLPFELRVEKVWERRPAYLELNPAGTVPTLVEDNGLVIPNSTVICEYLDEAYPDSSLIGRTLAERIEARRLEAWFDGKFAAEVTQNLYGEKYLRRLTQTGQSRPGGNSHWIHRVALSPRLYRLAGGDAQMARRERSVDGGFRSGGPHIDAGFYRRAGLVDLAAAAKSAIDRALPASHLRVSAPHSIQSR